MSICVLWKVRTVNLELGRVAGSHSAEMSVSLTESANSRCIGIICSHHCWKYAQRLFPLLTEISLLINL